jgi:hypothetical protein
MQKYKSSLFKARPVYKYRCLKGGERRSIASSCLDTFTAEQAISFSHNNNAGALSSWYDVGFRVIVILK